MEKTSDQIANTQAIANPNQRSVTLDYPIKRGETEIATVVLNKPTVGTLRGLSLQAVSEYDVDSTVTLLTRITSPTLNRNEIENMEISDFALLSNEMAYFLLSAKAKSQQAPTT
ncbi:phage tail assembly protein [Acinetobacter venetianus]|uniref:phage tail assembly protein n=1 Tax=Acinetobacter venetianus TaxID=52133 RepID=UPI00214F6E08|nr:phage tail assembly protein [Acinetobacter venetianus]MCR4529806.1 phage tail assembly protein [Acinetobacter venetianus]